ncbi:MAG: hypothetical protein LH629_03570, partial [Ignavibacteria bacterium]|nr:hypothetical protein [Ignavibacteria bacterium]
GYRNSKYKEINNSNYANNSYTTRIENSLPYTSYFFCPSVFENYYLNKYLIISSLIIPIEYITKREQYYNTFHTDRNTHEVYFETYSTIKWPKILQYGIYFNTGFYRKIYKGLYIGSQLGIGLSFESRFGNGLNIYKQIENGIVTQNETYTTNYKKFNSGRLDLRPTLSLHYNF